MIAVAAMIAPASVFAQEVKVTRTEDDKTITVVEETPTENGRIVMESTIDMIRRMNRKILISGVENRQQIEMLAEFDVDYTPVAYLASQVAQLRLLQWH